MNVYASTAVAPLSRERERLEVLSMKAEAKFAASRALQDSWRHEHDSARGIEVLLPADCVFIGVSLADLARVDLSDVARARNVGPEGSVHLWLSEARRAARHRERAAEYKVQLDKVAAEAAALNTLVRNCETYLNARGAA